jgi:DNA-binding response OmpR family regulator
VRKPGNNRDAGIGREETAVPTRVLIAEDEPNIVESLTFILKRSGFEVRSATDGEAALSALRSDRPDVMILDVMLPKMNGFDVLKTLRGEDGLRDLPVVLLTAKGQSQDRRMAEEIGANAFVTKPFSNQHIVDTVRAVAAT